jgi:hypothetical protein
MIIESLLSFLGGTAFRMIWGELSSYFTRKQEHAQELERLEANERFNSAQHARSMEAIRVQADMGIKVIEAQNHAQLEQLDAQTFLEGVKATAVITGIRLIDAWNASIRPGVATWAIVMLTLEAFALIAKMDESGTKAVAYAALGLFLADRNLAKRGK